MLNKDGFRDHGTCAVGTGQPSDCRQQMQKKDGQVRTRTIMARSRHTRAKCYESWDSPCTGNLSACVGPIIALILLSKPRS